MSRLLYLLLVVLGARDLLATTTITVDNSSSGASAHDCAPGFFDCTLSSALAKASTFSDGVVINFNADANQGGTFNVPRSITLTGTAFLNVSGGLTINGSDAGVTILGSGSGRVFDLTGNGLTLNKLTVSGGRLSGSSNGGAAAGVYVRAGTTLNLSSCTLSNNIGGSASAIRNEGTLVAVNSTFSGNSAITGSGTGGTLYNLGNMTMRYCTVSANSTVTSAAGVTTTAGSTLSLSDTILANNTGGDDILLASGSSVSGTNNIIRNGATSGLSNTLAVDPLLDVLGSNGGSTQTMALTALSPANQSGTPISGTSRDQRGLYRPESTPAIGAYQPLVVNFDSDGAGYNPNISFTDIFSVVTLRDAMNAAMNAAGTQLIILKTGTTLNQEESSAAKCAVYVQQRKYKPDATLAPLNLTLQAIPGSGLNSAIFLKRSLVDRIFFVSLDPGSSFTLNDLGLYFGNVTNSDGGAIASRGTTNLNRCALEQNKAQDGAALSCRFGTMTVTNCTIAGNSASSQGGGIFVSGQVNLINSTVAYNSAAFGGGLALNNNAVLVNSIVANNTAGTSNQNFGGSVDSSSHHNLTSATNGQNDYSGGMSNGVNGNIVGVNPRIQAYFSTDSYDATRTLALLTGSPAINAGSLVSGVTTDLRGIARPQGSAPDMGSYEARLLVPSLAQSSLNHLSTDLPFDLAIASGANPAGGVFGGTGVSGNYFYPPNASLGPNVVSYSLTSVDNITLSALLTINITQTPIVS